ncbi:hypothetical protein U0L90_00280 [Flavobacteriaceae sp. LMIT009]
MLKKLFIAFIFFQSISSIYTQEKVDPYIYDNLAVATFVTKFGSIKTYFPLGSLRQTISFTVKLEPLGNNQRQEQRNLQQLKEHSLQIGDHMFLLRQETFSLQGLNPGQNQLSLLLDNKLLDGVSLPIESKVNACQNACFPTYIVAGNIAKIGIGSDGLLPNKRVLINGDESPIVAVSEDQLYIEVPENVIGNTNVQLIVDEVILEKEINVLKLNLSADRLNLLRGQQTKLNIEVNGLDGLEEAVTFTITNSSPKNITLEGGNEQRIVIKPEDAVSGTFQIAKNVEAIANGGFSISANIAPPEETEEPIEDSPLCHCIIDDYSYLISPESCEELGGLPYNEYINQEPQSNVEPSVIAYNERLVYTILGSMDDDIAELEEEVEKNNEAYEKVKKRKKEAEERYNQLVAIDKVLDSVPKTYKDKLKKIVDSLLKVKEKIPNNVDATALQKAVDDAQKRVEACEDRVKELEEHEEKLKEQLNTDEEELIKSLEYLKGILEDYNIELKYEFNEDGSVSISEDRSGMYKYDKERIDDESEFIEDLKKELNKKRKAYTKTRKKIEEIPDQIEDAKEDCKKLEAMLEKAKEAKSNSDLALAIEAELGSVCEELRRVLARLRRWCAQNPDYCTKEDVDKVSEYCPKTLEEFERFWKGFDELLKKKKGIEDDFGDKVEDSSKEMEDLDKEYEDLKNKISALEEAKRKKQLEEQEKQRKIAQAEAEQAAKAKAARDKRERERKKQKKEDDKIKRLVKKAQAEDAGDEAFQDLLEGMGLSLLDEATGDTKLGTIIAGLLAAKEIPDCTCKLMKALKEAISGRDRLEGVAIHVEGYIRLWEECANLTSFPVSVAIGGNELTEAIEDMTDSQASIAKKALEQAIRIQCK